MSAQRLRDAAERLRDVARNATPPPWSYADNGNCCWVQDRVGRTVGRVGDINGEDEWDARFIATMHPGVALALADWLDGIAAGWPWDEPFEEDRPTWDDGTPMHLHETVDSLALSVADQILGAES